MRVSVLLCSLIAVSAACVDADDDDDDDTLPFSTTAPPGGPCGRDWNTFDPRRTYVVASIDNIGCRLFDPFAPDAFAARLLCFARGDWLGLISPTTGEMHYGMGASTVYRFSADLPVDDSEPCDLRPSNYSRDTTDDVVFEGDGLRPLVDQQDRQLLGNDEDGWQIGGRRVLGYVVAVNVDGDALVAINDVTPSPWRLERADGTSVRVPLPPDICTTCAGRSVKRDGRAFRLVGVRDDEIVGWRVEADGTTSTFARYARCDFCQFDHVALLDDDSILVAARSGPEIVQLQPDGVGTAVVAPAIGNTFGIVRFVSGP